MRTGLTNININIGVKQLNTNIYKVQITGLITKEIHLADIYLVMRETQPSATWITCLTSSENKYGYSFNNPITPCLNYLSSFSNRNLEERGGC